MTLNPSPQPGNGRGRERDGIAMREGCRKGAGIHLHFPHSRYFLSRRKQSLHCYPIINYFFHSFAEASRKVKNNINVRRKCTVWHCNAIKHFLQFLMMRFQCGYLGLQQCQTISVFPLSYERPLMQSQCIRPQEIGIPAGIGKGAGLMPNGRDRDGRALG